MAKKKKSRSPAAITKNRPTRKETSPPRKAVSRRKAGSALLPIPGGATLLAEAMPFQCPTKVYDGIVILADNRRAFLRTANGTYLMLLDPDCSGVVSAGRVDAAYATFSQNPGGNQRLRCNGFLHEDGSAVCLHVVNLNVI